MARWKNPSTGEIVRSCTIVTTAANELVQEAHDRMPAPLTRAAENVWLDTETDADEASALLLPFPAAEMRSGAVSQLVNNVNNEGPTLLIR